MTTLDRWVQRLIWLVLGLAVGCISGLIIAELPGNSRADRAEVRVRELHQHIASLEKDLAISQQLEDELTSELLRYAQREREVAAGLERLGQRGREVEDWLLRLQPMAEAIEAAAEQP